MINSDKELEKKVIANCMMYEPAVLIALELIKRDEVFTDKSCRSAFKAIRELYTTGVDIDHTSIINKAAELKLEARDDFYLFIANLFEKSTGNTTQKQDCLFLLNYYAQRRLKEVGVRISNLSGNDTKDAQGLTAEAMGYLDEVQKELSIEETKTYEQQVDEVEEEIKRMGKGQKVTGNETGLHELDRVTGGYQPGHYVTIAGRPGMGKTALALKNAVTCAKRKGPVAFFSLEMTSHELIKRVIASESTTFTMKEMFHNGVKPEQYEQLKHDTDKAKSLPLIIDDQSTSLDDIIYKIKKYKMQHGIRQVVIDYVGLMGGYSFKKYSGETDKLTEITRELKQTAKKLNIPIIGLAQLNRKVEDRGGDKRPQLSDLKSSGSVEEDSNLVIMVYRPEEYDIDEWEDGSSTAGQVELMVLKNRNGATGYVKAQYVGNKTAFFDIEPDTGYFRPEVSGDFEPDFQHDDTPF